MNKKKARFNFLDVLIILGVLALVAGIIWRQELTQRIQIENSENTVTVACGFVSSNAVFKDGTFTVYYNGEEIGSVERKTVEVSVEPTEDGEEPTHTTTVEQALTLNVVEKESGYYLNGDTKLVLNGEYNFHTDVQEFTVNITSITKQEKD